MYTLVGCGGLVLILAVPECANALKDNYFASRHRAFAVAHERRNMGGDDERRRALQLAAERVEVSCGSQITE